ncbi:HupE/UreJ family protein [Ahrensia sp. R2A130]|uniref:HupE/UreJ family protein n=1 Tax=Ahrensia sp. R2A130 TaxID=744979 RepID=UPI0001E0B535|nr:HupE/UreJ family protein [Ahrensia sp. R2A130]EFL87801.1 putative membrane protein [Ahrensia sp. R2A130]
MPAGLRPLFIFIVAAFAAVFSNLPQHAYAHEVRPAIAELTFAENGGAVLKLDATLEALLAEIPPDVTDTDDAPQAELYDQLRALPPSELEARFREFLPKWLAKTPLNFGDSAAELNLTGIEIPEVGDIESARNSVLTFDVTVPAGVEQFTWAYPNEYGASVLRVARPGQELQAQFVPAGGSLGPLEVGTAAELPWYETAWTYLVSGFDHIVPKGLDHILFVLGLFFLAPRLKPLLWQVSAFTLAHTITLAMGLYGIINISPSIVEPIIALSIVYVAVENIVTKELHPWRPVIVFLFGLLHGLGFAGVLAEFGLPAGQVPLALISFNIGVEAGQLFVIAIAALLLFWAFNKPWYRKAIAIPASLFIGAMGAYWFVERTIL